VPRKVFRVFNQISNIFWNNAVFYLPWNLRRPFICASGACWAADPSRLSDWAHLISAFESSKGYFSGSFSLALARHLAFISHKNHSYGPFLSAHLDQMVHMFRKAHGPALLRLFSLLGSVYGSWQIAVYKLVNIPVKFQGGTKKIACSFSFAALLRMLRHALCTVASTVWAPHWAACAFSVLGSFLWLKANNVTVHMHVS
jgi:hypothetical protein